MISVLMAQSTSTTIQNPAAEAIRSLSNLDEACGDDKSWACRWIFDWTGSNTWAGLADWMIAKPLAILVILVAAFLANRVVLEMLSGIAYRRGGGTWAGIPPTLLSGRTPPAGA